MTHYCPFDKAFETDLSEGTKNCPFISGARITWILAIIFMLTTPCVQFALVAQKCCEKCQEARPCCSGGFLIPMLASIFAAGCGVLSFLFFDSLEFGATGGIWYIAASFLLTLVGSVLYFMASRKYWKEENPELRRESQAGTGLHASRLSVVTSPGADLSSE
jgi:hypothetical protein